MREINLGIKIHDERKKIGVTQGELAEFLGVSKAAVSKWESGISYPDITLLPLLATYFNVSIDEVLGYEPQMLVSEIKKLYLKLTNDFAVKPFEEVYEVCESYLKKYYSCWKLQFYMGLLLINHVDMAKNQNETEKILKEARSIFDRIATFNDEFNLTQKAIQLKALCCLSLGEYKEVIEEMESFIGTSSSTEVILARAYKIKGDQQKAESFLQGYIYSNVIGIFSALPELMILKPEDHEKTKKCYEKAIALGDIFELDKLYPIAYLNVYLFTADLLVKQGKKFEALDLLEKYVDIASLELFPLKLEGNDFFDNLEPFIKKCDLSTDPPRDERVIKKSIQEIVLKNPVFEALKSEERFIHLSKKLEKI